MQKKATQVSTAPPTARSELLIKILFFILFIALLIFQNTQHISDRMFWLDEVTTLKISILPFWEIPYKAAVTSGHMQPPLFYWLGHITAYVGSDPIILRSVSVACYTLLLWFVVFRMHELQIASRLTLCCILLVTPFASYATTEFRPYALSAFSILVSSMYLYRFLQQPSSWSKALMYGLSALILQYSLTLNCFVFGVQMLFLSFYIITSFFKTGIRESLPKTRPVITIAILLCSQYALFLYLVVNNQEYQLDGSFAAYIEHVTTNWEVLFRTLSIDSWTRYIVFGFFVFGCLYGLIVNCRIILYLLLIFGGQLLFSTYMTYSAITWFSQRYLVASYVAFALICALGAEALFRQLGKKISVVLVILLLVSPMFNAVKSFSRSQHETKFNPSTSVIEKLRCDGRKTVVLSVPAGISAVPRYAYRNDSAIIVPHRDSIDEAISKGSSLGHCFILQEFKKPRKDSDNYFNKLSALPDYTKERYTTKPGLHVPGSGWLFTPNEHISTHVISKQ
jgi:hypothetical protein